MKLILDTHVLLWWPADDPALPAAAAAMVCDPENTVFVSAVTLWEIWLKQSLGKVRLPGSFEEKLAAEGFESQPLTGAQARAVALLPWFHRDPFDRMLVAQAQTEGLTLLTADSAVAAYGDAVHFVS